MQNRHIYSPNSDLGVITTTAPISKGGTGATTALQAVHNLGGFSNSEANTANQLLESDATNHIPANLLPKSMPRVVTVEGPVTLAHNAVQAYTITNFDSYTTYTITPIRGAVNVVNETITYTAPSTAGTGGFIINGTPSVVTIT